MKIVDLVIIGGGSAGMAAAIQAKKEGVDNLLILEKNDTLGGILNQCIHNGFGLTEFKEELTGPEYLQRFVDQVHELDIPYKLSSAVINITRDKVVSYSNPVDGSVSVQAKAIVLATGCYERNAGAIQLPGDRCSGIITAGTAQKYLNIHGYLVGKRVVILGSGDIGLIMARRLTLEGAKVVCVAEIMPYSNGLNRNIAQCLNDYNIPLYLSTSVSRVIGKGRLQKVILSNVDDNFKFIPGTEMEIPCDTLILSVGLVPYVSLLENIGVPMSSTKGALVNEHMETMIPGIFTCGNCLHVHDVVDFVTDEGRLAGHGAALYLQNLLLGVREINVYPNSGVSYVVPQKVNLDNQEDVTFKFRVQKPVKDVFVLFESNNVIISKVFKSALIPSEMIMIKVNRDKLANVTGDITVHLEGR
ncbi:MAG: FAD-dependent oxidoreductase [Erysipelotrichaceae bacterium]|jgi:thioredoxin reductase|nr:FAD-dependent oxidoreductase [Erysipelotrichaceae bacterium]